MAKATYTQAGRPLVVKFQRLADDALLLERFSGSEGISTLFSFTLDLLAPMARQSTSGLCWATT